MQENINKINTITSKITSTILSYDSGDVMTVSDIMDDIEAIKSIKDIDNNISGICDFLLSFCNAELKNTNKDFSNYITFGIDNINEINNADEATIEWKTKRAKEWLEESQKKLAESSTTNEENETQKTEEPKNESTESESIVSSEDKEKEENNSKQNSSEKTNTLEKKETSKEENVKQEQSLDSGIDQDMLGSFISDCQERFSRGQELILLMEEEPDNLEYIKELFRIFHTIKGEAGFLKLTSIGFLTHNIENVMDLLRSEKLSIDENIIELLLKGIDLSKELLNEISNNIFITQRQLQIDVYVESLFGITSNVKAKLGDILVDKNIIKKDELNQIIQEQKANGFEKKLGQIIVEKNILKEDELQQLLSNQTSPKNENPSDSKATDTIEKNPEVKTTTEKPSLQIEQKSTQKHSTTINDSIIKVKASKINFIVDEIGELLISLGQIQDNSQEMTQIRKIARSLQFSGMQLRTESVRILFGTVKRIIRDTSMKLQKPVLTKFIGEDLEIDRLLIESLEEPLMHLVRNALDHGIESREERIALGKNPEGTITVSAERRGNNIVISVADDGKGLDRNKILAKAFEKGLINSDNLSSISDSVVNNMIFASGFSTKSNVDYISGRGVGMDIIKQAVVKSKGHIETISHAGKGTTFELFFPLSTAIIDGMTVRTGPNIFIIPITIIIESLKMKKENISKVRNGTTVLNLRGQLIPIISLADVFRIPTKEQGQMATIIENVNRERFAIVSDEIIAKREIVIKSLGAAFKDFRGISSGTVLSGGAIGFVLDAEQFIQMGIEEKLTQAIPTITESTNVI